MNSNNIQFFTKASQDSKGNIVLTISIAFASPRGFRRLTHYGRRFKISIVFDPNKFTIKNPQLSGWSNLASEKQVESSFGVSLFGLSGGRKASLKSAKKTIRESEGKRDKYLTYNFEGGLPNTKNNKEEIALTIEFEVQVHTSDLSIPIWIETTWQGVIHCCHLAGAFSIAPIAIVSPIKTTPINKELIAITPYFFDRLKIPIVILEGDGLYEYHNGKLGMITHRWKPRPSYTLKSLPSELRQLCNKVLEEKIKIAKDKAQVLYNGRLARLTDFKPMRDDTEGFRGLELRLQSTDYYTFLATNHALESSLTENIKRSGLIEVEKKSVTNFSDSLLANPLTVTINIITQEPDGTERLVIQKRNQSKVMHCWQSWQAGSAGMVNMQPDTSSTIPNPFFAAAIREIKQETGLEVSEADIVFLALVRETHFFEVGLVGEVRIKRSYRHILGCIEDSFESEKFIAIPFTPSDFVRFLREVGREKLAKERHSLNKRAEEIKAGIKDYVPLALAAAVLSLVHSCGSSKAVENSFFE
ncbi:MAG: NUDIX hydrolase [Syntrophobacterales bacterium]|jgi:8-oxo-dGTP pyrophosphatase MutT (NUDIX family)|nr:NUDIX hydrolase [Syntrophobacterales bacterium]